MSAPVVHPPSIDRDTQTIEHLGFAPPCEYSRHSSAASAALIVWFINPHACGCVGPEVVNFCNPCWEFRCDGNVIVCPRCHSDIGGAWDSILRVERIS